MAEEYQNLNHKYYHDFFKFGGRSVWMEKIWQEAFGDAYPQGLDHYGYITQHDLTTMASLLDLPPGSTVLDIGCGKGGPGLRLAEQLDLKLIGIDLIPEAVAQAQDFQKTFDLKYPADFQAGEFYAIPLAPDSVDAVISIDALWTVPNKVQALMCVKRVLKPGGKFVFTHWDQLATDPTTAFELSGMRVLSRSDTPDWLMYQERVYAGITKYAEALVEEMGEAANMLLYEAEASPPYLKLSVRRVYCMGE